MKQYENDPPTGDLLPAAQDLNDRACRLVLISIARFPQTWEGGTLVADSVLREFEPNAEPSRSRTNVGMQEIAAIEPDGEVYAPIVNKIHDQFGIPNRVTPARAELYIRFGAFAGLSTIHETTREVATDMGLIPGHASTTEIADLGTIPKGKLSIEENVVQALHGFLTRHDGVRSLVAETVSMEAQKIRSGSRAQQRAAQAKIGHKSY